MVAHERFNCTRLSLTQWPARKVLRNPTLDGVWKSSSKNGNTLLANYREINSVDSAGVRQNPGLQTCFPQHKANTTRLLISASTSKYRSKWIMQNTITKIASWLFGVAEEEEIIHTGFMKAKRFNDRIDTETQKLWQKSIRNDLNFYPYPGSCHGLSWKLT